MRIQTLTAPTMPEALRMIREQLGPEALILGTRKVPGADGKPTLEITAALEEPASLSRPAEAPASDIPASILPRTPKAPAGKAPTRHTLPAILAQHGVAEHLITRITSAMPGLVEAGFAEPEALEMLLTKLATFKPLADLLTPGKAHIFIGPHGAGKTTLVAKLAVHFHKQGFPVGLLSLDDEKIGGMEPLAVVAESLGDRAHLVTDLTTLRAAATQMGGRHMLLIDTPGINPYQPGTLAKLEDRLNKLGLPATVHLVAPANLGHDDMTLLPVATQRFAPTSLAITRLDAASRFGGLFTTAADSGLLLGLASHSPMLSTPPLPLTAPWLAQTLAQYPTQPWELPA